MSKQNDFDRKQRVEAIKAMTPDKPAGADAGKPVEEMTREECKQWCSCMGYTLDLHGLGAGVMYYKLMSVRFDTKIVDSWLAASREAVRNLRAVQVNAREPLEAKIAELEAKVKALC